MSHAHCCNSKNKSAFAQTLNEMDYERGIWSSANEGDFSRVKIFLQKGVSADERDSAGYTALHYAAMKGYTDICKLLIKHGADVNARTRAGQATALHRASSGGREEVVQLLLDSGAQVELQDADGRTALHRAYLNNQTHIAELLIIGYPQLLSLVDSKNKLPEHYRKN